MAEVVIGEKTWNRFDYNNNNNNNNNLFPSQLPYKQGK